jgi:hypothetical protein
MREFETYTISNARKDTSESLYVLNNATRITKRPSEIILAYKSQHGDANPIPIVRTSNPIDLSLFAPKDELLRNADFLRLVNKGMLTLLNEDDANRILSSQEGRAETERLRIKDIESMANLGKSVKDLDSEVDVLIPQELQQPALGEVDRRTLGVTPSIVSIMADTAYDDVTKATMLRNMKIDDILTDKDCEYIRSKTNDTAIRRAIS